MHRRQFVNSVVGGVGVSLLPSWLYAGDRKAERPMKILVLGGTGFLGPHQINHALARGHKVTMFNRGSNAGMYGDAVEELIGNRDDKVDAGLEALRGDRRWDVVVDNSGYVPRHVRDSARLLAPNVLHYLFVSTVSVYASFTSDIDERDRPFMTGDRTPEGFFNVKNGLDLGDKPAFETYPGPRELSL